MYFPHDSRTPQWSSGQQPLMACQLALALFSALPGLFTWSHLSRTRSDSLTGRTDLLALHVCHVPTCVWRAPARSVGQLFARSRVFFFFFFAFTAYRKVLTTYIWFFFPFFFFHPWENTWRSCVFAKYTFINLSQTGTCSVWKYKSSNKFRDRR